MQCEPAVATADSHFAICTCTAACLPLFVGLPGFCFLPWFASAGLFLSRSAVRCAGMAWHGIGSVVNDSPCVQTDPKARPSAMHVTFVRCRLNPTKLELFAVSLNRSSLCATASSSRCRMHVCVRACVRACARVVPSGHLCESVCVRLCACCVRECVCVHVCVHLCVRMWVHEVLIRVCFQLLLFSAVPVPAWLDRQ